MFLLFINIVVLFAVSVDLGLPSSGAKVHLVAKLDDLCVRMCAHEKSFAELHIKGECLF